VLSSFIAVIVYLIALLPGSYDPEAIMPWKGWAAFVVSADRLVGMGWGSTPQEAEEKAIAACRRKSLSCADEASITDQPTDKVALVCCRLPAMGCALGVAETDRKAISYAEAFTEAQEWGGCWVKAVYSVRTGFRQ
jgi:O-acetyl-ADP-ribose deacetylase (regulator of RNase III)